MRNALAEWILSLVTSKDRVSTILGDLLETQPGAIAFWSALLRIAISIGLHRPYRLLFKALWLAIDICGYILWIWVFTRVIGVSYLLAVLSLIPGQLVAWRLRVRRHRRGSTLSEARRT